MDFQMKLRAFVGACVVLVVPFASIRVMEAQADSSGSVSEQVREIFGRVDDLVTARHQRYRQSLFSLSDEELAKAYVQATAPQRVSLAEMNSLSEQAQAKVKKERPSVIEYLAKVCSPYDEKEYQSFRSQYGTLADELASLGPAAVPVLCVEMADAYRKTGHWDFPAREAMVKMGPGAVESLVSLMDSEDDQVRGRTSDGEDPEGPAG